MTHVQKFWSSETVFENLESDKETFNTIKLWLKENSSLPGFINDEQIILFLHSCYNDVEATKKCIESYYKIRAEKPPFFEIRDIHSEHLKKALNVLHYGIFPEKTPNGCKIIFHKLNDTKPSNYAFNDGFNILMMTIDAINAKEGPQDGLIMLFDLKGVKLGHIIRLPLYSVRKGLEYIQDALPVRLKAIHVLNVHSIMDKIMILIKPFLRKKFLELLHFHKENDEELYKIIPRKCLPRDYGGELDSVQFYHDKFIEEMESLRSIFVQEMFLFSANKISKQDNTQNDNDLTNLNIH